MTDGNSVSLYRLPAGEDRAEPDEVVVGEKEVSRDFTQRLPCTMVSA